MTGDLSQTISTWLKIERLPNPLAQRSFCQSCSPSPKGPTTEEMSHSAETDVKPTPKLTAGPSQQNYPSNDAALPAAPTSDKKQNMPSGAVLTEKDVLEIFLQRPKRELDSSGKNTFTADSEAKPTLLAQQFQVASKTIRDIWNRNTWVRTTKPHWNAAELAAAGEKVEGAGTIVAAQVRKRGRPSGAKDALPRTRTCKKKMPDAAAKAAQLAAHSQIQGLMLASQQLAQQTSGVVAQHAPSLPSDSWDVQPQTSGSHNLVAPTYWTPAQDFTQSSWLPHQTSRSDGHSQAIMGGANVQAAGGAAVHSWQQEAKMPAVDAGAMSQDWSQSPQPLASQAQASDQNQMWGYQMPSTHQQVQQQQYQQAATIQPNTMQQASMQQQQQQLQQSPFHHHQQQQQQQQQQQHQQHFHQHSRQPSMQQQQQQPLAPQTQVLPHQQPSMQPLPPQQQQQPALPMQQQPLQHALHAQMQPQMHAQVQPQVPVQVHAPMQQVHQAWSFDAAAPGAPPAPAVNFLPGLPNNKLAHSHPPRNPGQQWWDQGTGGTGYDVQKVFAGQPLAVPQDVLQMPTTNTPQGSSGAGFVSSIVDNAVADSGSAHGQLHQTSLADPGAGFNFQQHVPVQQHVMPQNQAWSQPGF